MKTFKIILTLLLLFSVHILRAQNTCQVVITGINIANSANYPQFDIKITGKVINGTCPAVVVTLYCPAGRPNMPPFEQQSVAVDATTQEWTATFNNYYCECSGSGNSSKFSVSAECKDKTLCGGSDKKTFEYRCPAPGGCPVVNFVQVDIGPCMNDNATSCGYRMITFTPTVTGTPTFFQWSFGDGSPDVSGNGMPTAISHKYLKPPAISPKLTLFTINCTPPDFVYIIPGVTFTICDDCPADAQIGFTSAIDQCHLTGTVIANFCADQYNSCVIDFGDGHTETVSNPNLLNGYLIDHTYTANGNYDVSIILQKNGENCTYMKTIMITDCTGNDNDDDNGGCILCICTDFWCCLLFVLFILAMITAAISLAVALCNGNNTAWIVFGISLASAILFGILLVAVCDVDICALLLTIAITNTVNWGIICGTNLIPCNSWLCQLTTLPVLGIQVSNYLIGIIVIWLLTLAFCAL
jgi:hypothetical protein